MATAGIAPEAMRNAVAASLRSVGCAFVGGSLAEGGAVTLRGVVGAGASAKALFAAVHEAAPDAPVDPRLTEAPAPYCATLSAVHPFAPSFGSASPLSISLRDGRTDLVKDETIELHASMPPYTTHLQVDYFSSNGTVAHVLNSLEGGTAYPAGSVQVLPIGAVDKPYGVDMIIAIASDTALFEKNQKLPERTDAYVRLLNAVLTTQRAATPNIAVDVVALRTREKR